MSKKLTGLNNLSYLGVEATTPPQLVRYDRAPTVNDYAGFNIGTIWIDTNVEEIYILTNKDKYVSTWQLFQTGLTPGDVTDVQGGDNINCDNSGGPIVTVNLNKYIDQPDTNAAGTEGMYQLNSTNFLHAYGTKNTFLGKDSGNLTLTTLSATENTGIGANSLGSLTTGGSCVGVGHMALLANTTGNSNTSIGSGSGLTLSTGWNNTSVGSGSLDQLATGDSNTIIGQGSGHNYTGAESSNICISNDGVLGEDNTIHIGTEGTGAGQQDTTFIAGIYDAVSFPLATTQVVVIDDNGQLAGSSGDNGQLIIGNDLGSPAWATLGSSDGSVIITNGANSIDLVAVGGGGGGGSTTFITDVDSPAVISGSNITMAGGNVIQTDGTTANTVTFNLTNGTDGQVLIGGGANPAWANLIAGTNVTIVEGPNSITISATGSGGGGSAIFETDAGNAYVNATGTIKIVGGANINTAGATDTVVVNLDNSISLPSTNAAGTSGLLSINSLDFLHSYGTDNTFLGESAGNRTLTTGSAISNTAIGSNVLAALTTGEANTSIGSFSSQVLDTASGNSSLGALSLNNLDSGDYNTTVGTTSFYSITSGTNNVGLGYKAGYNHSAGDSSNICIGNEGQNGQSNVIRIGTEGTGAGQQDTTYMAGVYTGTAGATKRIVEVDDDGQLGTSASTNGQVLIGSTAGSPAWSTLTAGTNVTITNAANSITIAASGGTATVNLITWRANKSSSLIGTVSDVSYGADGYYVGTGGSTLLATATQPYGTWTKNTVSIPSIFNGISNNVNAVNYGNGKWVCVGTAHFAGSVTKIIAVASDPSGTWSSITNPLTGWGQDVAYGDDGYWVVAATGPQIVIATDPTGTWSNITTHPFTTALKTVAYGNGYWVIGGQSGEIAYATDPSGTWSTPTHSITNTFSQIIYANGYWVAVGGGGLLAITQDPSGTWVNIDHPMGSKELRSVSYNNGLWSILSEYGDTMVSTDLTTWKYGLGLAETYTGTYYPTVTTYGGGYWVAGGYNGYIWVGTQL